MENIFDLEVPVEQRRLEGVHRSEALAHVDEYGEDFGLGKALTEATVHHVDDATTRTKLHEDEDLIRPVRHAMPCSVKEEDNVGVAFEDALGVACSCELQARYIDTHHDVDLLLDLCEHPLVGHSNPLEHMLRRPVHRLRRSYQIHIRIST